MRLTSPFNLPAPGRRQWLYRVLLDFAATCVFAKQSLEPILCGPQELGSAWDPHPGGLPFSRSYGDILPSSFSTDHSSTLGFSPRLPVSVCGTVGAATPARGFSWRPASRALGFVRRLRLGIRSHLEREGFASPARLRRCIGTPRTRRLFCFRVPPCGQTRLLRHGTLHPFPITYASRPRLRGRLTRSG